MEHEAVTLTSDEVRRFEELSRALRRDCPWARDGDDLLEAAPRGLRAADEAVRPVRAQARRAARLGWLARPSRWGRPAARVVAAAVGVAACAASSLVAGLLVGPWWAVAVLAAELVLGVGALAGRWWVRRRRRPRWAPPGASPTVGRSRPWLGRSRSPRPSS